MPHFETNYNQDLKMDKIFNDPLECIILNLLVDVHTKEYRKYKLSSLNSLQVHPNQ